MQQDMLSTITPYLSQLRRSLHKLAITRRGIVVGVVLILTLIATVYGMRIGSASTPEQETVSAEKIVICIGVIRDASGMQHAFFQRGGDTLEQTLTESGKTAIVREGFTVEHRNCYDSWQKAADFVTDGQVTLPENATEQDFTMALIKWKQQQQ